MKLYFSSGYRFFIWLQIGLQFIFPIIATIPISVMAEESPPPLAYSNVITEVAQSLSSDAQNPVKNTATSLIVGESSSVAEKWLGQFGTARISLDVDEHGNWDRSSFDFLYPIYDNEKSLLFTQLGARAPNGRITGNLGLGVRTYHDNNWMFGGNVFFDHDFTGENRRVGIGAEAWTDYLKLSANTYVGTSDWHTSHDFDNYNEKPADGFDIRVETYIPSLPQVGVKGMYEQYYGNEVALFNKEHKQRNPSAITTGLTYTPIPMITTGVDYRLGQQSQDEFKFTLNFRYELGSSLQSQLSPEQVGSYRTLAGSRYNLVERNNEIILQYKEKPQTRTLADISISSVKDNSPADGISQNIVTVHAVDSNGQAIKNIPIIWSIEGDGKLSNYSGITDNNGNLSVAITNTVIEKSLVTAKTGSLIRTIPTNFTDAVATLELSSLKDGAVANGSEQNISQVVVKDSNGNALSDIPINWKLNNGAKITYSDQITNNEGKALVKFTNISVGSVSVDAQSGEHIGKTTASFVEIPVGTLQVSMLSNNAPADGASENTAQVVVLDKNGKALPDVEVNWTLSGNAVATTPLSVITGADGIAKVRLTDTSVEAVTVSAQARGQSGKTTASFVEIPVGTLQVSMLSNNAPADGASENTAQVVVLDKNGKALPDVEVNWTLSGNAVATTPLSVITGADGIAKVSLTDTSVEAVTVSAQARGQSGKTTASFVEIPVGTLQVSMLSNNAPADGASENTAQVVVLDKNGKALPDVEVNWTLSGNAVATTPLSVITGADGIAKVRLTDTSVEAVTVSAQARGQSGKTTASFVEIPVGTLQVSMLSNNAPADGASENTAQVVVLDKNGKALPDVEVNWTLSGNAVATTPLSVITGADGIAKVSLTDTSVEAVTVSAQARGQSGKTTASFVEIPVGTLQVSMLSNNAPADGASENTAQVVVLDKNGKVLPDVEVNWTLSGNAVATTPLSVITGSDGIAKVSLTDTSVEVVTVSAQARGQSGFTSAKFDNIKVASITLESTGRGYKADPGVVTATVIDKNGNPVSGVNITWDTPALGNHFLTCSNIGTVSDIQGQASYTCYTQGGTVSQMPFKVSVSSDFAEDPANPPSDSLTRNYFLN